MARWRGRFRPFRFLTRWLFWRPVQFVRAGWRELLLNGAILGGWALLALSLSSLTGRPRVIWPAIGFLVLWGYAGYGFIARVLYHGLYSLSHGAPEPRSGSRRSHRE